MCCKGNSRIIGRATYLYGILWGFICRDYVLRHDFALLISFKKTRQALQCLPSIARVLFLSRAQTYFMHFLAPQDFKEKDLKRTEYLALEGRTLIKGLICQCKNLIRAKKTLRSAKMASLICLPFCIRKLLMMQKN